MRIIDLRGQNLSRAELLAAMPRAAMGTSEATDLVRPILDDVKERGAAGGQIRNGLVHLGEALAVQAQGGALRAQHVRAALGAAQNGLGLAGQQRGQRCGLCREDRHQHPVGLHRGHLPAGQ